MEQASAYIAGAVRGLSPQTSASFFAKKEAQLRSMGYRSIANPISIIGDENINRLRRGLGPLGDEVPEQRRQIMAICISRMALCDEVHLLHNWQQSQGATLERNIAQMMGKKIVYPHG